MSFSITDILIHNQVDYTMVSSTRAKHWMTSRSWILSLFIPVTIYLLEDLDRTLKSDRARPRLTSLSTTAPCVA